MIITQVLDYFNLFTHCNLIGTTGSGKTTYLLAIIKDLIMEHRNNNLIFIDGKNDPDLVIKLQDLCNQYHYNFHHYRNDENDHGNFTYDYLHNKSYSEIKEIILRLRAKDISSVSLGANYYFEKTNNLLFLIVRSLIYSKVDVSWTNILNYCNKKNLYEILNKDLDYHEYASFDLNVYSDAITFIKKNCEQHLSDENLHSVKELINTSNNVILFSLDFLSSQEESKQLAQAICIDIRQSIKYKHHDLFCCLDEFGSYINSDLQSLITQGRSYHVSMILSYQSLGQLNKPEFKNIIFDNTNNWFVFNVKHEQSAKELALLFGMTKSYDLGYKVNLTNDEIVANTASLKQTDTYAVSPNEIKMLLPMQCFIKTLKVPRFFSKGIDKEED